MEILFWRDVKTTGAIFLACILLLTSFNHFTVVTVTTYLLMLALVPPLIYRLAISLKSAVLKTECEHPFREWLECDINAFIGKDDKTKLPKLLKDALSDCRRIVLVEDIIDTVKVLVIIYVASHLGEWFSGITLMYLAVIITFSIPKIYDMYRKDINNLGNKVTTLIDDLKKRVFASVPSKIKTPGSKKPNGNGAKGGKNIEEIGKNPVAGDIVDEEDQDKEKIS